MLTLLIVVAVYLIQFLLIGRVLLRRALQPTVRLAWVMVIALVPVVGVIFYLLFGEVRLLRAKLQRIKDVQSRLQLALASDADPEARVAPAFAPVFENGQATGGLPPTDGNRATLLPEGDAALADVIARIDAARDHVHVLFYIWLPDRTGTNMARALVRAAGRGVTCRVLVDDLGSRALIRSSLWRQMAAAGVDAVRAFPVGNPLVSFLIRRLDVRNHRKIVVVDNDVTWCGSNNCADSAFRIKARFAPWVDVLLRFEGPVVRQHQKVFLQDWMTYNHEDLGHLLADLAAPDPEGFIAQVIATGPDERRDDLSSTICAMLYSARRRLTITTPYYVPNVSLQSAVCACARRGVETTLIVPARNDSRIVAAASESLYGTLLDAGVRIMAFEDGLIHAKIVTMDGALSLVGSANMDHRSFDLNFENNILLHSEAVTEALDARQQGFLARSREITADEVAGWTYMRRIRNNLVALASPML